MRSSYRIKTILVRVHEGCHQVHTAAALIHTHPTSGRKKTSMKRLNHSLVLAAVISRMLLLPTNAADTRSTVFEDRSGTERGHHLEVKAISSPALVSEEESFNVFVTAVDEEGVGSIEVVFNDQKVSIKGNGQRFVTGMALFTARPPAGERGLNEISASVLSADGRTRGVAQIKQVDLTGPEGSRVPLPMPDFRDRLAEVEYPALTGAVANAEWPVNDRGFDTRPWWTRWEENNGPKPFDWTGLVEPGVTGITKDGKVLEAWLELYPHVGANLVWAELNPNLGVKDPWGMQVGVVTHLAYPNWTAAMKDELHVAVYHAWKYLHDGATSFGGPVLPAIAKNQMILKDKEGAKTLLSHDDAWKLYLATVAHSLAVELGGFVPWSIVNDKASDLAVLLNAATMFNHIGGMSWYVSDVAVRSESGYFIHDVLPAPPTLNFEFMLANDMIRPDHTRTIARYFDWGRKALFHSGRHIHAIGNIEDGRDAQSAQAYWGYRGASPAAQIMKGTYYTEPAPWTFVDPNRHSWVIGCPGASYFTQQTMRAVNIPVQVGNVGNTLHTTPFFWTIGATLSHGDDLYHDGGAPSTPPFPSKWFLLPMATYNDWFYGAGQLGPFGLGNVSRQSAIEIPLAALSDELIQRYCVDKAAGATHADGSVADFFQYEHLANPFYKVTYYTVAQLEALNLWSKLDAKAVALGFCAP